jgi:hypothetical protein
VPGPEVDLDPLVAGLRPGIAEVALVAGVAVAARDDWLNCHSPVCRRFNPGRFQVFNTRSVSP